MNQQHLDILKLGVTAWNNWRENHPEINPNLSGAVLNGLQASEINFTRTNLSHTVLCGARLSKSMFIGAKLDHTILIDALLDQCFFSGTQLYRTSFNSALLRASNFMRANLVEVDLSHADLEEADLRLARLEQVNLEFAKLNGVNLSNAGMNTCLSFGMHAANLEMRGLRVENLIVSNHAEPTVTINSLAIASRALSRIWKVDLDANGDLEKNLVLIFSSVYPGRQAIVNAVLEAAASRKLVPVVVHLDKKISRSFVETLRQLALLSHYMIADLTRMDDSLMALLEMLPQFRIPLQPLLKSAPKLPHFPAIMENCTWILEPYYYRTLEEAVASLEKRVFEPLEERVKRQS